MPLLHFTLRPRLRFPSHPFRSLLCCANKGEPGFLEKAQVYLSSLITSTTYFDPAATDGWEALLRGSAAAWGEASVGSVTGDYFLLETMASVVSCSFSAAPWFISSLTDEWVEPGKGSIRVISS